MGTLVELIALVKEIPESHLEEALEKVKEIKEKADSEKVTWCRVLLNHKFCDMMIT